MKGEVKSPLYTIERVLCCATWVGAVVYIYISIYRSTLEYEFSVDQDELKPGWFLGMRRDSSNFEWENWCRIIWHYVPAVLLHILLNQGLQKIAVKPKIRQFLVLAYDMGVVTSMYGIGTVYVHLAFCVASYVAALTKSVAVCWIISTGLLATLNHEPLISYLKYFCCSHQNDPEGIMFYAMTFTVAWTHLRCTSFSIEYCWSAKQDITSTSTSQNQGKNSNIKNPTSLRKKKLTGGHKAQEQFHAQTDILSGFIDLLEYVFYLPLQTFGPVTPYNVFCDAERNAKLVPDLKWKVLYVGRYLFWIIFMEISLHILYFNSIHNSYYLMQQVNLWSLAGVGYLMGQYFHVKYVVMYGLPRALALFDNKWAPEPPVCISWVYRYSNIWKEFDAGLYMFIKRYIYIPLGGSRHGLLRMLAGSMCCFVFVYYWHGAEAYLAVWVFMNFVGIVLESVGDYIEASPAFQQYERRWISEAWHNRLTALIQVPLLANSNIAIFCFFGGISTGFTYYRRLIIDGWPVSTLTVLGVLYCFIQTSREYSYYRNRKQIRYDKKQT